MVVRILTLTCVSLLALGTMAVGGGNDAKLGKQLEGTWRGTEKNFGSGGKEVVQIVIKGNRLVYTSDKHGKKEMTFRVVAAKHPAWIDLMVTNKNEEVTVHGLLSLEGNKLTLHFAKAGSPRPQRLGEALKGDGILDLKRTKK